MAQQMEICLVKQSCNQGPTHPKFSFFYFKGCDLLLKFVVLKFVSQSEFLTCFHSQSYTGYITAECFGCQLAMASMIVTRFVFSWKSCI